MLQKPGKSETRHLVSNKDGNLRQAAKPMLTLKGDCNTTPS
jgi:hypothetical protein